MAEKNKWFKCAKCGKRFWIRYDSIWTLLGGTTWTESAKQHKYAWRLAPTWFGNYIQCLPGGKKNTISEEDYDKYIDSFRSTKANLYLEITRKYKSLRESSPIYDEELKKLEQKRKEVVEIYRNRPLCRVKEIKD
jgi:hypothetical protein